jgi:hypothetical protein
MLKVSKVRMADVHGTTAKRTAFWHGNLPQGNDRHDPTLVTSATG